MSTTTKIALGAAAAGLLVIGAIALLDDEAPIRVRGGSMELEAYPFAGKTWRWELESGDSQNPNQPSYSHEPDGLHLDVTERDLYVKVEAGASGATCSSGNTFHGKQVVIEHGTFKATLNRARSGLLNYRIKVRPSGDFSLQGTMLQYTPNGFITAIRTLGPNSQSCTFSDAAALKLIHICTSASQTACQ